MVDGSSDGLIGVCLNEDCYTLTTDSQLTPETFEHRGVGELCVLTEINDRKHPKVLCLPPGPLSRVHLDL